MKRSPTHISQSVWSEFCDLPGPVIQACNVGNTAKPKDWRVKQRNREVCVMLGKFGFIFPSRRPTNRAEARVAWPILPVQRHHVGLVRKNRGLPHHAGVRPLAHAADLCRRQMGTSHEVAASAPFLTLPDRPHALWQIAALPH
jgi:hypothetical protein